MNKPLNVASQFEHNPLDFQTSVKASSPIILTLSGRTLDVRLSHRSKALFPILVILLPNFAQLRFLQQLKHSSPIFITPLVITTSQPTPE